MTHYLVRRVVGMMATLFVVSFLVYAILTFAPGDAAQMLIGENASREQVEALRQQLQLDVPFVQRWIDYTLKAVTRGDLGVSMLSGRQITEMVGERLPYTLGLAVLSMAVAALAGIAAGAVMAAHPGGRLAALVKGWIVLSQALPPYWIALILVQVLAVRLQWLPVLGTGTPAHLVMPVLTLALPGAAVVSRLVRAQILETLSADFIRTAMSKGLPKHYVLLRHVLPNSLVPAITVLGLNLGHLIGGAFVIETIFAWPGLGRLTVQAILDRDIPVVMGAVMITVPLILSINLLVDVLHAAVDPRVRDTTV